MRSPRSAAKWETDFRFRDGEIPMVLERAKVGTDGLGRPVYAWRERQYGGSKVRELSDSEVDALKARHGPGRTL
jgi:hypothetical protein